MNSRSWLGCALAFLACGGGGPSGVPGGPARQQLPAPANGYYSSLTGIWAFSDRDVWAVGSRVLHYDGSAWEEVAGPPGGAQLTALFGLAPDDLWATSGSQLFRWRGSAGGWEAFAHGISSPPDFDALWVLSADEYVVGGGAVNQEVVRVKAGAVSRKYTYGTARGIWGSGSDDVWAATEGGGAWHFNGTTWANDAPASVNDLRPTGVWGSGASDVWVVGDQGLAHWDGAQWTSTASENSLATVWGASATDVWAAGDGVVSHFDGASWTDTTVSPGVFFTGISGSGPSSVWAVGYELNAAGNHGVVFRLK